MLKIVAGSTRILSSPTQRNKDLRRRRAGIQVVRRAEPSAAPPEEVYPALVSVEAQGRGVPDLPGPEPPPLRVQPGGSAFDPGAIGEIRTS